MPPEPWYQKFHDRHGRYVELLSNKTVARRQGDTYDNGVVYSSRPLNLGEVFQLRVDEIETKWAGSLRFGVTTRDPNCPQTKIARAVTDLFSEDDSDYWTLSGSRVHNGQLEKEYHYCLHNLTKGSLVGVQVTKDGDLCYFVDGVCKGVAVSGLPVKKKLYAIFDLYGRTKQVSWVYYGAPSLEELCIRTISQTWGSQKLDSLPLPKNIIEQIKLSANNNS